MNNGTMDDFLNSEIIPLTVNGKCPNNCHECCSDILPLSTTEITTIKKYIKKHKIQQQKHILPLPSKAIDLICPFCDINTDKGCTIYEVRPKICRVFKCDWRGKPKKNEAEFLAREPVSMKRTFFNDPSENMMDLIQRMYNERI